VSEFHEAHRQKQQRLRHLPLCAAHVERNLVAPHDMVSIEGMGSECVWCGTDDVHTPAVWLVDLRVKM
jgi:hypothetical protein